MEVDKREYIANKIGDEYKQWEAGDIVFIEAPTGSGKSFFIQHILLKWAIENQRSILYLVNRKVLKEQIEEELMDSVEDELIQKFGAQYGGVKHYITVTTYQNIEASLNGTITDKFINRLRSFAYVVYDECHYFYSDSNFNTRTELSYDCLRKEFDGKVQILLFFTLFTTLCCTLFTTILEIIPNTTSHYSSPIMHIKCCYTKLKHII